MKKLTLETFERFLRDFTNLMKAQINFFDFKNYIFSLLSLNHINEKFTKKGKNMVGDDKTGGGFYSSNLEMELII